ncbi:hypothetical protein D3C81_1824460 [compost metagenome]
MPALPSVSVPAPVLVNVAPSALVTGPLNVRLLVALVTSTILPRIEPDLARVKPRSLVVVAPV